ncbi:GNAT family N-acetyltransferase [Actinomadura sp. ATCC 31491]|uniref:GNAT family N-acetyltransferase n=1 Tax=Actinomadura luzonensis TaxID=2805427 RepID=A0ABT0FZ61_9ACTN|nr:GNAT family N-acetyltransferase [Actinomadura luzonensis]MCK2217600.1 GNAT family N-acetyltransferase [Actinomadura luzonensis]
MTRQSEEAAAKAGVTVRELSAIHEFQEAGRLFDDIWHPDPSNVPVPLELMAGFAHAGGYVAGAFDDGGRLVGASVGFLAAERTLHSHVTGTTPGRGIGYALKLHQRDWCRERGLERVTWTFDPLVRRNARFNLVKLGARPGEYLEDFYGTMADAINEGDASDRLLAVWPVDPDEPLAALAGAESLPVLLAGEGDRPLVRGTAGEVVLVATPPDIEQLRRADPAAAREWRAAVRTVLGGLMGAGGEVIGFTDRGEYAVAVN